MTFRLVVTLAVLNDNGEVVTKSRAETHESQVVLREYVHLTNATQALGNMHELMEGLKKIV